MCQGIWALSYVIRNKDLNFSDPSFTMCNHHNMPPRVSTVLQCQLEVGT